MIDAFADELDLTGLGFGRANKGGTQSNEFISRKLEFDLSTDERHTLLKTYHDRYNRDNFNRKYLLDFVLPWRRTEGFVS